MSYKNEKNIKQINIKNCPDYLCNDTINNIINIKDFDLRPLKIRKLSFKGAFNINIYYIEYITKKSLDHKNIDN